MGEGRAGKKQESQPVPIVLCSYVLQSHQENERAHAEPLLVRKTQGWGLVSLWSQHLTTDQYAALLRVCFCMTTPHLMRAVDLGTLYAQPAAL